VDPLQIFSRHGGVKTFFQLEFLSSDSPREAPDQGYRGFIVNGVHESGISLRISKRMRFFKRADEPKGCFTLKRSALYPPKIY
jgi:hypothetical protein